MYLYKYTILAVKEKKLPIWAEFLLIRKTNFMIRKKLRWEEDIYGSKEQFRKRIKSCYNWRERTIYLPFSLSQDCYALFEFSYSPKAVSMLESTVT